MPLLVVALVVGAIALYGWGCYLAIAYVVLPSLPYAVATGVVVGVLLTVIVLVGTLTGVARFAPATVGPSEVGSRLPTRKGTAFPRDDAWPNYLFAQSRTDASTASGHIYRAVENTWIRAVTPVRNELWLLYLWPLLLLPLTALLVSRSP